MSRILRILSIAVVALALTTPAWAGESEEEQEIIKDLKEMWKEIAAKELSDVLVGPKGLIQASSSGGLWQVFETTEALAAFLEASPTMRFTPYHIDVRFLGSQKDVAYVTYYLVGTIAREGKEAIINYRTRASSVMEKTDGQWISVGSHYSPLFGGSGLVTD